MTLFIKPNRRELIQLVLEEVNRRREALSRELLKQDYVIKEALAARVRAWEAKRLEKAEKAGLAKTKYAAAIRQLVKAGVLRPSHYMSSDHKAIKLSYTANVEVPLSTLDLPPEPQLTPEETKQVENLSKQRAQIQYYVAEDALMSVIARESQQMQDYIQTTVDQLATALGLTISQMLPNPPEQLEQPKLEVKSTPVIKKKRGPYKKHHG